MADPTRRNVLRLSGATLLTTLAVPALAGCGSGSGGASGDGSDLQMTWWGDPTRNKLLQQAVDAYTAAHEGTEVTPQPGAWDGYFDKLATQVAGGNAADWIMMDQSYLAEYAERGSLADLGPFVGKELDLSNVPGDLVDSARIDGKLYVAPLATNTQIMLCNTSVLQEVGVELPGTDMTWDDFAQFADAVTKASDGQVAGCANRGGYIDAFEVWLRGQGRELYASQGQALAVQAADVTAWFGYWQDLQGSGAVISADAQAAADTAGAAADPLVTRQAATTFNWSPQWTNYQSLTDDRIDGHVLPQGAERPGQFVKAASYFCSPARGAATGPAAALTSFLLNDPGATTALGLTLGVPASTAVQSAITGNLDATGKAVVAYLEQVQQSSTPQERPWLRGHGDVSSALSRHYQDLSFARASLSDAVAAFMSDAQRAIEG